MITNRIKKKITEKSAGDNLKKVVLMEVLETIAQGRQGKRVLDKFIKSV